MEQVHATAIDIDGRGVLLRGPSASGKSDLALRLIDSGARLVADDRTDLALANAKLMASAPAELSDRMEVRGIGIVTVPGVPETTVALVVDLVDAASVDRLPEPETVELLGQLLPLVRIAPFEASAPAKVRTALSHFCAL